MGKVLEFKRKEENRQSRAAEKMVQIASEIDSIVLNYINDEDLEPRDIVGLLSHRLGTLMNHLDEKDELGFVCERVMKTQAKID